MIWCVEGESDAEGLISMGLIATTNFEGASIGKPKWRSEYSEWLAGSGLINIVADRDPVGIAHAQAVAATLKGKVGEIRMLQSRTEGKGHDVSDHLDAGYTLDQLERLGKPGVRQYRVVSLAQTMKMGIPAPVLLCDGLLYEGGLHSIAGAADCGKTTLALFWAVQLLQQGRRVIFLDEEGGEEIVTEKLQALGASCDDLEGITYCPFPARSWTNEDIGELITFTEEIH